MIMLGIDQTCNPFVEWSSLVVICTATPFVEWSS